MWMFAFLSLLAFSCVQPVGPGRLKHLNRCHANFHEVLWRHSRSPEEEISVSDPDFSPLRHEG